MSMIAALTQGRTLAQARMLSTCNVRRKTGATVQNETTGLDVPVWTTIHAAEPVRIDGGHSHASPYRRENVGGIEVDVAIREAHFRHNLPALADGDYIEVTAGESAGLVFSVDDATKTEQATAYRPKVRAVSRPVEWV